MSQSERLKKLNTIAISQMKLLTENHRIVELEEKNRANMRLETVKGE